LPSKRKKPKRQEKKEMPLPRLPERLMRRSMTLPLKPERSSMNFRLSSTRNNWRLRRLNLRRLSSTYGDQDPPVFPSFTVLSLTRSKLTKLSPRPSRIRWLPRQPTTLESHIPSRMRLNCTSPTKVSKPNRTTRELSSSPPMIESQS
jgi:hypothetical protein